MTTQTNAAPKPGANPQAMPVAWVLTADLDNMRYSGLAEVASSRDAFSHKLAVTPLYAAAPAQPEPDPQLCKFYSVGTFPELVAAMERHIEKLQAKLPPTPSMAPQQVRKA